MRGFSGKFCDLFGLVQQKQALDVLYLGEIPLHDGAIYHRRLLTK